jgi:CIC family chloride channel protein
MNPWGERIRAELKQHGDLAVALVLALIVSLTVVFFVYLTEHGVHNFFFPPDDAPWRRLVMPIVGALVAGFLVWRFFPDARGSGIPQTKAALVARDGFIDFKTVAGKFASCSISLGSGISLGREGPSVQIGAGIASVIGRALKLDAAAVKALIPVGTAAALAAAFNTPIAAVLFTLEEVISDLHARVLGTVVIGAAASWMLLHLLLGDEPLFHVPAYHLVHPAEFLLYALLGLLGGLMSHGFVWSTLASRLKFKALPKSTVPWQAAVGGLAVGLLAFWVPGVLGVGYHFVDEALNGQLPWRMMLFLLLMKGPLTAICYSSGNPGGIFGPSLFLGAMLGGSVGSLAHSIWPEFTATPGAYALVGMGAAFAGIIRTPMTSVIMIFELTRDYNIIVPLMISNMVSYWIASRLQEIPIYEALALQDGVHLPRPTERRAEHPIVVADAMRKSARIVGPDRRLFEVTGDSKRGTVLIGEGDTLLGVVNGHDAEEALLQWPPETTLREIWPLEQLEASAVSADLLPHVHPDHPLELALKRLGAHNLDVLPVLDRKDALRVVGEITLDDLLMYYRLQRGAK